MNAGHALSKRGQAWVGAPLARLVRAALERSSASAAAPASCTLAALARDLQALQHRDGPDAGLHLGAQASMAAFGVLGYLVMSSATLGQVLALMQRYESMVLRAGHTTLALHGAHAHLQWTLHAPATPCAALEDLILAAWCKLGPWLVGQALVPQQVCLTHRADGLQPVYERWFACPVQSDCAAAGVVFPAAWLELEVRHADPQMHSWMVARAGAELCAQATEGPWSARVSALLPELMATQSAQLGAAATVLGLSERSLRRRLQDEGTGFSTLLQHQRQTLACQYLSEGRLGVLDIALALGYAEHSAFSLAFRQWTGMTPSEYRSHHVRDAGFRHAAMRY